MTRTGSRGGAPAGSMVVGGLVLSPSLLALNPHLRAQSGKACAKVAPGAPRAQRRTRAVEITDARAERDEAAGRATLHLDGLRLASSVNRAEHRAVRGRRIARQRSAVEAALAQAGTPLPVPCVVTITRFGPRAMDSDNVVTACKHVRDAVAAWLLPVRQSDGRVVGDDSPSAPIEWRCVGEVRKTWGVRVVVEVSGGGAR